MIQRTSRFVCKHDTGTLNDQPGQSHPLLLPTGQPVDGLGAAPTKTHPLQGLFDRRRQGPQRPRLGGARNHQVVSDGRVVDQGIVLEQVAKDVTPEPPGLPTPELGDVTTAN